MKKILTVVISAIAFGLIAGLVMVGINIVSIKTGIVPQNAIVDSIENSASSVFDFTATKSEIKQVRSNKNYSNAYYEDLPELIKDTMPTVVSIYNTSVQLSRDIFGRQVEGTAEDRGSGVIVGMNDNQVIILTNNHVVSASKSLKVAFNDIDEVDASIKGVDSSKDLAIVSVNKKNIDEKILENIKISKIGNSDEIEVGDKVVAIGNALGIGQSVTYGIISAKDRVIKEIGNTSKLIQTDAAINPGNSGGALINLKGELIGINVAKSAGATIEGMGYAIPINVAAEVIETLKYKKDREYIPEEEQGQLGIIARDVDSNTAGSYDIPEGVFVYKIAEDSQARNSELREKDVIISFDNQSVKTISDLQELLKYTRAGQEVEITVMSPVMNSNERSYVKKTFKVKLGKKNLSNNNAQSNNTQNNANQNRQEQNNQMPNDGYYYYDPFFDDFESLFPFFRR